MALIDFGNEINAIILAYVVKLGLKIRSINIGGWTIDNSIFQTFEIPITSF